MTFRDLDEILGTVEPLTLPRRGKEYSFPGEIGADMWLKVQRLGALMQRVAQNPGTESDTEAQSDIDQDELLFELCGDTLAEILADEFTDRELKAVVGTLVAFHLSGREAAEEVWNNQGNPPAPNREQRRKVQSSPKNATRTRGSRSGSTSPVSEAPMAARGTKS